MIQIPAITIKINKIPPKIPSAMIKIFVLLFSTNQIETLVENESEGFIIVMAFGELISKISSKYVLDIIFSQQISCSQFKKPAIQFSQYLVWTNIKTGVCLVSIKTVIGFQLQGIVNVSESLEGIFFIIVKPEARIWLSYEQNTPCLPGKQAKQYLLVSAVMPTQGVNAFAKQLNVTVTERGVDSKFIMQQQIVSPIATFYVFTFCFLPVFAASISALVVILGLQC